jgi:mRNA-degrading endonuclease RelE of RelBE toxin-antitoxin system
MTLPAKRSLEKTKAFSRDVKRLPQHIVEAGWKVAQTLQDNIFAPELNIRKMEGYDRVWRVVVKKVYRLVYTFDTSKIYLLRFAHRKEIYRLNIDWD